MHAVSPKSKLLAPFVETLWSVESNGLVGREILLPDGKMQLLFDLTGIGFRDFDLGGSTRHCVSSGSALQGPRTRPVVIDKSSQRSACGVSFFPGGAAPFFSIAACELNDHLVDLRDIWGQGAQNLVARLAEEKTAEGRIRALESMLTEKFRPADKHGGRTRFVVSQLRAQRAIGSIEEELGMHARGFIAWFRQQVGPLPKQYARLARFQELLSTWEDPGNWGGRAAAAGYADQAHMNREFKLFAGITPKEYRPIAHGALNHLEAVGVRNIQDWQCA
jgi:Helix-turn-helix domain